MKRIAALILTLAMVAALSVPALASETQLIFEYEDPAQNEPAYTITVPALIELSLEGTSAEYKAEGVQNIPDGQKISVRVAGTTAGGIGMNNNFYLIDPDQDPRIFHQYDIELEDGTILNGRYTQANKELVSFTEDRTAELIFTAKFYGNSYDYYGTYTGSITYGIGLEAA